MDKESQSKKNIGEDFAQILDGCAKLFAPNEFSRVTGIRIELLRRFINKQARQARAETWDKIYPSIRELVEDETVPAGQPTRIGPPYRRHNELVEMVSDQKVLLDVFNVLAPEEQTKTLARWVKLSGNAAPSEFQSLSPEENRLMGAWLAMEPELRDKELLELVAFATKQMRKQRKAM